MRRDALGATVSTRDKLQACWVYDNKLLQPWILYLLTRLRLKLFFKTVFTLFLFLAYFSISVVYLQVLTPTQLV